MRTSLLPLVFLALGGPSVFAQSEDTPSTNRWSLGLYGQHLYDVRYTSQDDLANGFSGEDPFGLNGTKTLFDQGLGLRAKYSATPMLSLDATWTTGSMSGANQAEYYRSKVNFVMLGANYALRPSNQVGLYRWLPYARLALGASAYQSTRYFLTDDVAFASTEGLTLTSDLGLGMRYYINDRWSLNGELVWTTVATDAWDGYNYGTGRDEMIRSSFGISYTFGKGVNVDRMPGFKDGRVDGLVSLVSEVESTVASLESELAKVKSANDAAVKKFMLKQDSLASALMAVMEQRFLDAQKAKEGTQNLNTIYFGFNRAEISLADQVLLSAIAAELAQDPSRSVSVQAFSDEVGDEASNEKIRRGRERAVVGYLYKRGIRKAQIQVLPWNGIYTGIDHYDRRVEVKRAY